MNRRVAITVVALAVAAAGAAQRPGAPDLAAAPWVVDEVGLGVEWRSLRVTDLFGARQSLHALIVELPRRTRRLRFIAPAPFGRVRTSEQAAAAGALAAVNGGFFDTGDGTPLGLLRQDGALRTAQDDRRDVAIGVDRRERILIEPRGPGDWPEIDHARGGWPLILRNGSIVRPEGWGGRDRRHPRTAAGLTTERRLVLLTVDGRADEAAGMTLWELAATMQALGCETALNLDGGGSTTMWLRGRGVVNCPSDNGVFDHAGERAVGDCVLVFAPAVVRLDEDRARLLPDDGWSPAEHDEQCIGADYALSRAPGAEARFEVELAPGRYRVELRVPGVRGTARRLECRVGGGDPTEFTAGRAHRWQAVVELEAGEEPVAITLRAPRDEPVAIDALRLVEVKE